MFCLPIAMPLHFQECVVVWLHSKQTSGCSVEDFVCYFYPDLLALGNTLSFVARVHTFRVYLPQYLAIQQLSEKNRKGIEMESRLCNCVFNARTPRLL